MLAPMSLSRPSSAWLFALITTVSSVAGGLFGYLIGLFLFELIEPVLHQMGYWEHFIQAQTWFDKWGFWAIFLAGFSPIPYKIFTIAAGAISMALLPFVAASCIGRGSRFFLVAALMRLGGPRMESMLRAHIDRIGWITVIVALTAYFLIER